MVARVLLTSEGQEDFDRLPRSMRTRVAAVFERLTGWPTVSGAKALRHEWKGHYRIRVGDWRVIFQIIKPDILIVRIKHRSEVYEE